MLTRLLKKPLELGKSFFLFGPRGTGKTTWIKNNLLQATYIDLLQTNTYLEFLANPGILEKYIPPNFSDWIVIDEVQRVPMLLNEVHRLIEEKKYKFVLTGSSSRSLRKQGVNLLAGRALVYNMHPLTVQELGVNFDLQKSLHFGHLPAIFSEPDPGAYLNAYVHMYLREEVMQEGLTRNAAAFQRFLEIASFSQGSVLNMAAIARDAMVKQKVVSSYFDILDDLLLGFRLPVFNKRAKRRVVNHPKFYYFDVGVFRILRPRSLLDAPEEIDGVSLETLFLQELRAINDYLELGYEIFYWRTQTGLEVDFVILGESGFHAFEIKRSAQVHSIDGKALRAFHEEFPQSKLHLLYGGERRLYLNNINAIPLVDALRELPQLIGAQ
jgi:uncharacterized protein